AASFHALKHMDTIIAPSEFTRQTIIQKLAIPANRIFTVHSGVNAEHFRPVQGSRQTLAEKYNVPNGEEDRNLLYDGSELPRKNLTTLLQALKYLRDSIASLRLLKVGRAGGEQFRVHTRRLIKQLSLERSILFFDNVPDADLATFYNAADVYVCTSFLEGFDE